MDGRRVPACGPPASAWVAHRQAPGTRPGPERWPASTEHREGRGQVLRSALQGCPERGGKPSGDRPLLSPESGVRRSPGQPRPPELIRKINRARGAHRLHARVRGLLPRCGEGLGAGTQARPRWLRPLRRRLGGGSRGVDSVWKGQNAAPAALGCLTASASAPCPPLAASGPAGSRAPTCHRQGRGKPAGHGGWGQEGWSPRCRSWTGGSGRAPPVTLRSPLPREPRGPWPLVTVWALPGSWPSLM